MKRTSLMSGIGILLIVVLLVLVNLIANTAFLRFDLTEGNIYSLSKASKKVAGNLEDPLTIKVFASENLSPQLNDVKRYLNDLLSDYQTYGHGKFRYEFIDPASDEELEKEAQGYRVPPFQENVWNKDKLELKRVYLGMVLLYGDKQETIPTIQTTSGLEYNITSMIKRMTQQQEQTVAFLTGHGEPDMNEEMQQLVQLLKGNYVVRTLDLSTETPDPENINALVIASPIEEIPDSQLVLIDQYLMKGGSVGLFFSPVECDLQRGTAKARGFNFAEMTVPYGFAINANLIADKNANMINIQERRGFFTIQNTITYNFFPNITQFSAENPTVTDLDLISLFFPSEIDTSNHLAGSTGKVTPLFWSSDNSFVQTRPFSINVDNQIPEEKFTDSSRVLAAAIEGPLQSMYKEAELPANSPINKDELVTESPAGTRMIVVGDGLFLRDSYMTTPANLYFALNSVDWLMGDTDLIQLRSREVALRPLAEISDGQRSFWKYFNWFGPPIAAILIGIVYWQIRKRRRNREAAA